MPVWRRLIGALLVLSGLLGMFGLSGCAALRADQTRALLAQVPADLPPQRALSDTPFYPQEALQCGPAALAMVMGAAGVRTTPDAVSPEVFLPGRGGSLQLDMLAAPRAHGLVSTRIPPSMSALLYEVAAGHPVVLLLNLGLSIYPVWHYAVAMGYDLPAGDILLRSGRTALMRMPLATLEHTWKRSGQWAFVVLPPDQLPATASESDVTDGRVGFERVAPPRLAALAYRVAAQRWPDNLVLGLGWGNALYAAGDARGAAEVLARVARAHDRAAVWNNLAMALLKQGDPQAALAAAQRAVQSASEREPRWLAPAQATLDEVRQTLSGKQPAAGVSPPFPGIASP